MPHWCYFDIILIFANFPEAAICSSWESHFNKKCEEEQMSCSNHFMRSSWRSSLRRNSWRLLLGGTAYWQSCWQLWRLSMTDHQLLFNFLCFRIELSGKHAASCVDSMAVNYILIRSLACLHLNFSKNEKSIA